MRNLWWCAALTLLVGCVPKAKYLELEADYDACQQELTVAQNKAKEMEGRLGHIMRRIDKQIESLKELVKDFRPLIDKGVMEVRIDKGSITLGLASDVLFASGSADLSEDGKATLTEVAKLLAKRPEHEFQVQGHTDTDPISSSKYPDNWHLGAARSLEVTTFLVDNGMKPTQVSAASFGEHAPVVDNTSDENKAKNRRIELVVVADLSDMPGIERLIQAQREALGTAGPPPGPPPHKPPKKGN